MTIGIVAGLSEELAVFGPGAPGEVCHEDALAVRRTTIAGREIALCSAGIGKVAAATAAAHLHAVHGATLLMVIGTAASVGAEAGRTFRIVEALQSDYGARRPNRFARYTAGTIPVGAEILSPFIALDVTGCSLPIARIASADRFIESSAHAAEIASSLRASLIDMETAAVAQVANLFGLPWTAVKATTDAADENSAINFRANLASAAVEAARAAEALIPLL